MADVTDVDYGLLDRAGAAATMFYPRPDPSPPPPGATDQLLEVEAGVAVGARFYVLGAEHPTLLYFHGNGEVAGDHDALAPLYHEIGLNLFVAEFRGYGRSGGTPSVAHLVGDAHPVAEAFHRLLDEQGFDARRYIMGRSLGAHPALELAARDGARFGGLIIESGAAGVSGMLRRSGLAETEEGERLRAAHEAKIRSIRIPTLQIHGELDELVPLATAAELYDLLEATARELVVIPEGGHNDLLWRGLGRYFDAIRTFVLGPEAADDA